MNHGRPWGLLIVLVACIAVGLGALGLSVQNAVEIDQEADRRNAERINADHEACERGNTFRQHVIDIGAATDGMITGILDTVFFSSNPERAEAAAELRRALDAPIADFRATVSKIHLIDCAQAVPGAEEAP